MMHCLGRHMLFCCAVTTNGHHVQATYIHVHGCSVLAISTYLILNIVVMQYTNIDILQL